MDSFRARQEDSQEAADRRNLLRAFGLGNGYVRQSDQEHSLQGRSQIIQTYLKERKHMAETKFTRYNKKCKFFCFRFRKEADEKYIEFLDKCPNRMDFIRKAIDAELTK